MIIIIARMLRRTQEIARCQRYCGSLRGATDCAAQAGLLLLCLGTEARREADVEVRAPLEVAASREDVLIVVVGERLSPWSRCPATKHKNTSCGARPL